MEISKKEEDGKLIVSVKGRMDTTTTPQVEESIGDFSGDLIFDFTDLEYISSAGLRLLLTLQKKTTKSGASMTIRNANVTVKEVFNITGFADIFTME